MERKSAGSPSEHAVALLAGQNRALELIARSAPLPEVLDFLTRMIEDNAPGLLCSVLLLEGGHLYHGAAPSLPESYNQAVEGVAIGPCVGSCGTAAYTGRSVFVEDIATDPLWAGYPAELALAHGLRACWSTPIRGAGGELLGTFALYYRQPSGPAPEHLHLVEVATHLASIAIERRRMDEALAERARRLVEADRRKDEFLAVLAHELRNPLAPIATAVQLMRRNAATVERNCGVIERQIAVLTRLVDDLLDLSRVARGALALQKERTTAGAAVARAVEATRPYIERRGHALRVVVPEEPIELDADPVRISQVLSNLLTNAAKYTEPGGHLEVSAAREEGEVVLSVRDDGVGIPPDMLDRVFELFVQADATEACVPGGLGIGLTLVKRLVELHGGRVAASSPGRGKGTTMTVRLPAAREESHGEEPGPAAPRQVAHPAVRHVLLVDDNADAAQTLADALRDERTEIAVAYDGPSALAAAAARCPDAAIVDIGLPGMDGYELARRLRAACPGSLRLVALTGYGHEADQLRAREAGFDAHLVKPADVDRILEAISG